jgi:tyrosyl-tRNA synthetase
MSSFLSELRWRGQVNQVTDEAGLEKHLATGTRRGYIGLDPTADSLTIGNLVPIMTLSRLQRDGHVPVVIMGGGTGLIGDPGGKDAERPLLTRETVAANVNSQRRIFEALLDFSPGLSNRALLFNNADWLANLGYIEVLRDVGKHFSVNVMIQKDSVRERLHGREQGISYTEFSYMVLQAYDYLHLFRSHGVTLQMGGSDQWGNIVAGVELIRKVRAREAQAAGLPEAQRDEVFALTFPLITKADGGKFGKSESGAVWLTADRTSPYAFYQFWLNAADADVPKYLRTFTLFGREEIEAFIGQHERDPGAREAHRALARHMTELLHGATERDRAEQAAKALFSGEVSQLDARTLNEVLGSAPSSEHDKGLLSGGVVLLDLLIETGLAKSKRESREFLQNGSITVNGHPATAETRLTSEHLLHGRVIALRRGKKNWHVTRWA